MRFVVIALTLCAAAPAMAADMRIVCETRTGIHQRLDIVLPDGGEPTVTAAVGDDQEMFSETPRVLSHVVTGFRGNEPLNWLSTIHVESKVTDEKGVTRLYPPQTFYVDWRRARVWKQFFSLMDLPGGSEVENCVRVD
jgi:hypothetical protein